MKRHIVNSLLIGVWLASCGPRDRGGESAQGDERHETGDESACPARATATLPLPNTRAELETLSYWLAQRKDLDEPLLSHEVLQAQNRAVRGIDNDSPRTTDLTRSLSHEELQAELKGRLRFIREKLASGDYTAEDRDKALAAVEETTLARFRDARALRVALETTALYCAPFAATLRSKSLDPRFDRNRCSSARAQEPIEILGETSTGFLLARTRYTFGFVRPDAALSDVVPEALDARYRQGHELSLTQPLTVSGLTLAPTTLVLASEDGHGAHIATSQGFSRVDLDTAQAFDTHRPLTRRTFLTEAFRYIGSPYGWGDERGGRDCSRLTLDVMAAFGLHLPRTSTLQSLAGSYSVELPAEASAVDRLSLLDEADQRGVVLIHFPGHIMIYLGRDREGVPRALHSFAEYVAPCPEGGETLYEVSRVSVTGLDLGTDTSRRSFLERMTRLTVFGKAPGHALLAYAKFRASEPPTELSPAECRDSKDVAVFRSPREPVAGQAMRVIAVSGEDLRPMSIWLVDPKGNLMAPAVNDLGVGPFARWTETKASAGRWTVVVGDGTRRAACEQFVVASKPDKQPPAARTDTSPVWQARSRWERDTERFYSAFVEQLFSHDVNDMRTWSSLSELLVEPQYNLLFNYFGKNEDLALKLSPDCADLPYFLRAYFAWKLGLPFGYRGCTRGKPGVPPRCNAILTNEEAFPSANDVTAFRDFARTKLASHVHSASGRTLPTDENSDLYPLPFSREALRPGAVFADPYGHMIVVAKWLPQGPSGSGVLLGADAQPDATVGRRRFWPGNFLFTPDTRDAGAGFKAFRPVVRDEEKQTLVALDDKAISQHSEFVAPSQEQYQGSADDFYTRMDELIYPRPVSIDDRLKALVDALEEQAARRVSAIDTGEAYLRERPHVIAMPDGHDVFETQGPWEDFATPSRDMRLLIAIDTVRDFPQKVRAQPARFGLSGQEARKALDRLEQTLSDALGARRIRYTRTDGSPFELTLAQVVQRADAIEVGYNPNDCIEARWGAPLDSEERAPCKRSAPAAQRAKMEQYRTWFQTRTRPPR